MEYAVSHNATEALEVLIGYFPYDEKAFFKAIKNNNKNTLTIFLHESCYKEKLAMALEHCVKTLQDYEQGEIRTTGQAFEHYLRSFQYLLAYATKTQHDTLLEHYPQLNSKRERTAGVFQESLRQFT